MPNDDDETVARDGAPDARDGLLLVFDPDDGDNQAMWDQVCRLVTGLAPKASGDGSAEF